MNTRRSRHINESFKREISNAIQKMKDPRISDNIITISDLSVSPDFSFCKVHISTLNGFNHSRKVCKILNYASGHIQSLLSYRLKSRAIPKLLFVPCDSSEYAFKIDSLLSNINERSNKDRFNRVINFLKENDNFSIYTHENPDGDAIGSSVALYLSLKKIGKQVKIYYDKYIEKFSFINDLILHDDFISKHNICLDCSERKRLGKFKDENFDICIDHHDIDNCNVSDLFYIDKNSSSTAEIIYEIINAMNIDIDSDIATCIYTGIICDTGRFKWSNVNKRTFEISSSIIDKVDKDINHKIFDNVSKNVINFQSEIIKKFEYFDKYCLVVVLMGTYSKFGIDYSDLDFLSSFPLQIKDIEVSIIIKEISENKFKVSVRSFNGEAIKICKKFNGGGHNNASGFEIEGTIDKIRNRILNELQI